MTARDQVGNILVPIFPSKHLTPLLKYFDEAIKKYRENDWEGVALKAGKFVEAVTKSLLVYCKKDIPRARVFKAGNLLKSLEQLDSSLYHDTIRIMIPKSCLFIYEIVNNRGGRHDSDDIDANEMDAKAIIPSMSWVLAEMVRYASSGSSNPAEALTLIEKITEKIYPFFEDIDGRTYININGMSGKDIAISILYFKYPRRILRQELIDSVVRHGLRKNAADVSVHRIKNLVDDDNGMWKLRGLGLQRAEEIFKTALHG